MMPLAFPNEGGRLSSAAARAERDCGSDNPRPNRPPTRNASRRDNCASARKPGHPRDAGNEPRMNVSPKENGLDTSALTGARKPPSMHQRLYKLRPVRTISTLFPGL